MRIETIKPNPGPTFTAKTIIHANENKEVQFLFNKVMDITKVEKTNGGNWVMGPESRIELNSAAKGLLEKLKELGIKFHVKD